jgi:hypothetical protein
MYKLKVLFTIWTIDYETFRGKGSGVVVPFGPFDSEQQARWFWLSMKDKLQRKYDIAVIIDSDGKEVYVDEQGG